MSTVATSSRPYDIVVWGATGFTGALVVEYLTNNAAANGIKFAVGGRNKAKLQQVLDRVAARTGISESADIIIADSNDQDSLDKMVAQAKVVITTVGPYAKYGEKLVSACVRIKTDYVDLTGEPQFVRAMAEKYHDLAVKNNVLIVNSCGFDSIPSDLGTFIIADYFAAMGLKTKSVKYSLVGLSGGISGGTIGSAIEIMSTVPRKELIALGQNANYSVPESKEIVRAKPVIMDFDKDFNAWQTIGVMELPTSATCTGFQYTESMRCSNYFAALITTIAISAGFFFIWFPITRWIIGKVLPPGSGPSDAAIKKGRFTVHLVGQSHFSDAGEQVKAKAVVKGISDPGYGETAKMISESALCLALQRAQIGTSATGRFKSVTGGVATPASTMGMLLVERLRKAGMTFEVKSL
ncbi:Saccharopine dehydrogenase-domain-containing protein [Entophlyctis helioformis]|nr:Saccharopine dehydrogenase-domain-containing protein [Entophlyctis helioformis]